MARKLLKNATPVKLAIGPNDNVLAQYMPEKELFVIIVRTDAAAKREESKTGKSTILANCRFSPVQLGDEAGLLTLNLCLPHSARAGTGIMGNVESMFA